MLGSQVGPPGNVAGSGFRKPFQSKFSGMVDAKRSGAPYEAGFGTSAGMEKLCRPAGPMVDGISGGCREAACVGRPVDRGSVFHAAP